MCRRSTAVSGMSLHAFVIRAKAGTFEWGAAAAEDSDGIYLAPRGKPSALHDVTAVFTAMGTIRGRTALRSHVDKDSEEVSL